MTRLAISLATRGRPEQLIDTVTKSVANWTNPRTVLYIMADGDDEPTADAIGRWGKLGDRIKLSVRPREDTIAEKWNRVIEFEPDADLYLIAADDDPYVTPGYDQKLLDAAARFPDGIGMVYGHMANASFSGVVAPTRGLVDKLGHIFPTYFPYWFVDHWTDDIAKMIDRISFADVRTDQSRAGKTQEMREPGWWATWFDAAYLMRRKIAHGILDDLKTEELDYIRLQSKHEWRWKDVDRIRSCAPLIEYRSRWINDQVRQLAPQYEHWSGLSNGDARYQRVKQRAIDMVPHLLKDYGMDPAEAARYSDALCPTPLTSAVTRWSA
jgi:hypothetical protein